MGDRELADMTGEGEQGERIFEFRRDVTGDFKFNREGEVFLRNSLYLMCQSDVSFCVKR